MGELTPGLLSETVTRGVLRYAFEHVHRDPYAARGSEPVDLRLSTVLVGTHVQAVTARDSLAGLLYGVWRAAQLLLQMPGGPQPVRIREVEVIEIDEHIALDAAYELRRLLARDEWAERLRWDHPVLEVREGGIRGYRPRAVGSVWQRLVVRQDALGGLNFALIGERARVESTQVYSDVASLRRFIDRVSDHQTGAADRIASPTDPRFGGVLFQMLLPYELKERLANLDNTVLVVDDESARYPWELLSPALAGPADGETPRPFVVHAGLVRQRVTDDFRRLPQAITGYDALIVGAPSTANWQDDRRAPLAFSTLEGAEAEAQAVNELLLHDDREWLPSSLIGPTVSFEQVRIALLEKPYRLLHLCGHGVVDQWVRTMGSGLDAHEIRKTGMVLSHQEVLTAADVDQMNPPPEFVFINCCYSGRDAEGLTTPGAGPRKHPILAASLALQFIKMGSKAVVAAGWQVDDAAALLFAKTLYRALLDGEAFGEAVRGAREAVHADSGAQHNTWGAYQCYGDPQWRLHAPARAAAASAGTSLLRDADGCMSAHELADRIVQVVAVAGDKPAAAVLGQIDRLLATLAADEARRAWLSDSRVRSALGCAYRELGDHDSAARALQLGARSAYSQVQIGQLELLVNSLSRSASPDAQLAAESLLDRLDDVSNDTLGRWPLGDQDVAPTSATSERQGLRGGFVLRQAARLLDEDKALGAVAEALVKAAKLFASAYRSKRHFGDAADRRAYALSNAMLAAALAGLARRELGVAEAASPRPARRTPGLRRWARSRCGSRRPARCLTSWRRWTTWRVSGTRRPSSSCWSPARCSRTCRTPPIRSTTSPWRWTCWTGPWCDGPRRSRWKACSTASCWYATCRSRCSGSRGRIPGKTCARCCRCSPRTRWPGWPPAAAGGTDGSPPSMSVRPRVAPARRATSARRRTDCGQPLDSLHRRPSAGPSPRERRPHAPHHRLLPGAAVAVHLPRPPALLGHRPQGRRNDPRDAGRPGGQGVPGVGWPAAGQARATAPGVPAGGAQALQRVAARPAEPRTQVLPGQRRRRRTADHRGRPARRRRCCNGHRRQHPARGVGPRPQHRRRSGARIAAGRARAAGRAARGRALAGGAGAVRGRFAGGGRCRGVRRAELRGAG
ncbi:CHAT domain protein [Methylibium sp. T29-B]|nr:CHAT domain protein [Methylibium sp. T29-B]